MGVEESSSAPPSREDKGRLACSAGARVDDFNGLEARRGVGADESAGVVAAVELRDRVLLLRERVFCAGEVAVVVVAACAWWSVEAETV